MVRCSQSCPSSLSTLCRSVSGNAILSFFLLSKKTVQLPLAAADTISIPLTIEAKQKAPQHFVVAHRFDDTQPIATPPLIPGRSILNSLHRRSRPLPEWLKKGILRV
jgi:hypothetical protein